MTRFGVRTLRRDTAPHVDPAGGDPVLAGLRAAATAGDIAAVSATLRNFSGHDLSSLVRGISDLAGMDQELPELARRSPDDLLPRLLLGSRTINRAWSVRTAASAAEVSQEQFAQFHTLLEEAEEYLYDAARLDSSSSAPWHFLVVSGRGLEVGPDVSRRRFEAVVSRDPDHFGAHRQRLQQLCKKWGGSHEQMHDFARQAMLRSADPQMGVLVAEAHVEQWTDLGGGRSGQAYIRSKEVRESLTDAATRSIDRIDYAPARDPYLGFNMFAFAFTAAGLLSEAKGVFTRTHGVVTKAPWEYLSGQPLDGYLRWRETANKNG
ncbi:MAG: hypothetical protein J2P27_02125 [Actinobacteria bacterium]|nr:hypothetical protein [Actinomycetota bacterium]